MTDALARLRLAIAEVSDRLVHRANYTPEWNAALEWATELSVEMR